MRTFLPCHQSRSQSFVPLDQRSENESSGSNWEHPFSNNNGNNRILHIRFYCACVRSAQSACMVSIAHAWNGCSQSSRFPTAGQGERSSGNEIALSCSWQVVTWYKSDLPDLAFGFVHKRSGNEIMVTHQNLRLGKCWKLFWATLIVAIKIISLLP